VAMNRVVILDGEVVIGNGDPLKWAVEGRRVGVRGRIWKGMLDL
jgi:hypothetical protein